MAEAIDSLFVRLGLKTDKEQFSEADSQFKSLKTTALQFGGAMATVGAAGFGLVNQFAGRTDEIGQFADRMDTSAQFVNALGFAIEKVGGNADDAFGSIENMRSLLQDADWGRIGDNLESLSAGLDFEAIRNAETLRDAYLEISEQIQGLSRVDQQRVLDELGFGGEQMNLFMAGPEAIQASFGRIEDLAPVTAEMAENARDFNEALTELTTNARGVSDVLANRLAPAFTQAINALVGDGSRGSFEQAYEGAIDSVSRGPVQLLGDISQGNLGDAASTAGGILAGGYGEIFDRATVVPQAILGAINDALYEAFSTGSDDTQAPAGFPAERGGPTYNVQVDARGATSPQATEDAVTRGVLRTVEELSGRARDDFVEQRQ